MGHGDIGTMSDVLFARSAQNRYPVTTFIAGYVVNRSAASICKKSVHFRRHFNGQGGARSRASAVIKPLW